MEKNNTIARTVTYFAVLLALVIVLQLFASGITVGTVTLNFSLIPIVLGAIILGPYFGAALGVVCGLVIFFAGLSGADAFTSILIGDHPVLTLLLCVTKTGAAGLISGFLYLLLGKKNAYVGSFVSAAVVPIVNTAIFILGALMMSGTLKKNFVADGQTVVYFLVVVCAGMNFIFEFALNLILAPAIAQVVRVVEKRKF